MVDLSCCSWLFLLLSVRGSFLYCGCHTCLARARRWQALPAGPRSDDHFSSRQPHSPPPLSPIHDTPPLHESPFPLLSPSRRFPCPSLPRPPAGVPSPTLPSPLLSPPPTLPLPDSSRSRLSPTPACPPPAFPACRDARMPLPREVFLGRAAATGGGRRRAGGCGGFEEAALSMLRDTAGGGGGCSRPGGVAHCCAISMPRR